MSFALPALKVRPEYGNNEDKIQDSTFGVPNAMVAGLGGIRPKLGVSHPLEASEKNFHQNEEKLNLAMLRNIQGLHAPMKITMERKFASKVGRLPFLSSSNMQHDVLTGRYIEIGFEDILNTPEFCEVAGQPHAVMERSLGLL